MLYKYLDAKKIDLLAVMSNKSSDYSAQYIDLMNTWYGYSDIPIGIVRNGVPSDDAIAYGEVVATMKDEAGNPVWARTVENTQALPDAHILYRRILAAQPDGSVNIVSVGFSTNLARLLDTPADRSWIKADAMLNKPLRSEQIVAEINRLLGVLAHCRQGCSGVKESFLRVAHANRNLAFRSGHSHQLSGSEHRE